MKRYYSVKEAAKLLGFSTNTIYSYLDTGKIKSRRIGKGRFKIPYDELAPFVQVSHETTPEVASFIHAEPQPIAFTEQSNQQSGLLERPEPKYKIYDFDLSQIFVFSTLFGAAILSPVVYNFSSSTDVLRMVMLILMSVLVLSVSLFSTLEKVAWWSRYAWVLSGVMGFAVLYLDINSGLQNSILFAAFLFSFSASSILNSILGYKFLVEKVSLFCQVFVIGALASLSTALYFTIFPNVFPIESIGRLFEANPIISAFVWVFVIVGLLFFASRSKAQIALRSLSFLAISVFCGFSGLNFAFNSNWVNAFYAYSSASVALFSAYWLFVSDRVQKKTVWVFSLGFLSITFVILVSMLSLWWTSTSFIDSQRKLFASDLSSYTWSINRNFDRVRSSLATASTSGESIKFISNQAEDFSLRTLFDQLPYTKAVFLADRNGKMLTSYPDSYLKDTDFSNDEWFLMSKRILRPYVSSSTVFSDNESAVIYSTPIFENNQFVGVVSAVLDLDALVSVVTTEGGRQAVAVDREGVVVLDTRGTTHADGVDIDALNTEDNLFVSESVVTPNWKMALFAPISVTKQSVWPIYVVVSALIAVFSAVIMISSYVAAYKKSKS